MLPITVFPCSSEPRHSKSLAYIERRRCSRSLATQIRRAATANVHYGCTNRHRVLGFPVCRRAVVGACGTAWGPPAMCGPRACRQPPAPPYAPYPLSLQHLPLLIKLTSELNEGRTTEPAAAVAGDSGEEGGSQLGPTTPAPLGAVIDTESAPAAADTDAAVPGVLLAAALRLYIASDRLWLRLVSSSAARLLVCCLVKS
jgi:hypothetical protein